LLAEPVRLTTSDGQQPFITPFLFGPSELELQLNVTDLIFPTDILPITGIREDTKRQIRMTGPFGYFSSQKPGENRKQSQL
jgi:hypothetical protein